MSSFRMNFAAVAVAAFGVCLAPSAGARSTSAKNGAPLSYQNATCFSEWYATVTNTCASTAIWEMALVTDTPGTWNISVNVTTTSDPTSVSCQLFGVSQDAGTAGSSVWVTSQVFATRASVEQNLSLSTNVPMDGALYLACFLKENGRVNTVNWNQ